MRVRVLLIPAVLTAVLATASCSSSTARNAVSSAPTTSSAPSTSAPTTQVPTEAATTESSSPAIARNVSYDTVVALKAAAVAAGYACPHWVEDDQVRNAAESGSCSEDDVFAIYASDSSRDRQVQQTKDNNETLRAADIATGYVLFGPNWSILVDGKEAADFLRAALGGIETQ